MISKNYDRTETNKVAGVIMTEVKLNSQNYDRIDINP